MPHSFEFSVDTMKRCSGNTADDLEYARFFCDIAVKRAAEAASLLQSMVDLSYWSPNVFAEAESCYGLISGLHKECIYMLSFFDQKKHMLELFEKAFPRIAECKTSAQESIGVIDRRRLRY